jgi:hypothetical protein
MGALLACIVIGYCHKADTHLCGRARIAPVDGIRDDLGSVRQTRCAPHALAQLMIHIARRRQFRIVTRNEVARRYRDILIANAIALADDHRT